jgi:hypothetical protein
MKRIRDGDIRNIREIQDKMQSRAGMQKSQKMGNQTFCLGGL